MTRNLQSIFYSGYEAVIDWMVVDEIEQCMQKGVLRCDEHPIASHADYMSAIVGVRVADGLGPQGKGHMALKHLGQAWLTQLNKISDTEVRFAGLHPDIISLDGTMIIECGTTDANGVFFYFDRPNTQSVSILPYPNEQDAHLKLYTFYKTDKYDTYRRLRKDRIRAMVQRIRP